MTTRVGKPRALILENRRNREHAIVQLHIPKLAGVNTKRDGKWTLEPTGSKTTGRIIIPVTRAPERSEPRSSLRLIEFFSGGAKYRFCGIIFNEPRAHTFFEDQGGPSWRGGRDSAREQCPLVFIQACSLDGVSLWIRVRCPPVILVSSWAGLPSPFYAPQPPPSSSLPARACACAHAYTARRIFLSLSLSLALALSLSLLSFLFNGRSRRIDLTSTGGESSPGIKRLPIARPAFAQPLRNGPPCHTFISVKDTRLGFKFGASFLAVTASSGQHSCVFIIQWLALEINYSSLLPPPSSGQSKITTIDRSFFFFFSTLEIFESDTFSRSCIVVVHLPLRLVKFLSILSKFHLFVRYFFRSSFDADDSIVIVVKILT